MSGIKRIFARALSVLFSMANQNGFHVVKMALGFIKMLRLKIENYNLKVIFPKLDF